MSRKVWKEWLLNSGIQDTGGGFYSWYDPVKKDYGYLYSEITGYGISTLLFLNSLEKDAVLLERAKYAGSWLIEKALDDSGGFKTRKYNIGSGDEAYSFENGLIYAFDCGMILCGLMNLWETTGVELYLNSATRLGDFLVEKMQRPDGGFFAYYITSQQRGVDEGHKWSTQTGGYHCKLSLGLIKLGMATGVDKYLDSAEKICLKAISYFKNGRFVTNKKDDSTHLHPHCYTAEGLLYAGYKLNRKRFLDYATQATEWALTLQEADGGIPFLFYSDGRPAQFQRTDILSQVLRLGLLLRGMNLLDKNYRDKLGRLAARLYEFQNRNEIVHQGGFSFGYDFDGRKIEHINAWCTMFAIQALSFYENSDYVPKENVINFLI